MIFSEYLPLAIIQDGILAAFAALGFASISNPSWKAMGASAALAAVGHGFRYFLIYGLSFTVVPATLFAAMLMGFMSFAMANWLRFPNEVFVFPALLPMIPGMYAYKSILALTRFIKVDQSDLQQVLFMESFRNGMMALFILAALVVGAAIPVMLFHKESFTLTRILKPKRS